MYATYLCNANLQLTECLGYFLCGEQLKLYSACGAAGVCQEAKDPASPTAADP